MTVTEGLFGLGYVVAAGLLVAGLALGLYLVVQLRKQSEK